MIAAPALSLYRTATGLLSPIAALWLRDRARRGKEDPSRMNERFGRYASVRPAGRVVWAHAASVGESGVAMALTEALGARHPDLSFLISTGTRTSADLIARRAPARTTHIYAPFDSQASVRRFLQHWRPDVGVFVESEVWPNLVINARASGVRLALVNARMSPRSLRRWRAWPRTARRLFQAFDFISSGDTRTAEALSHIEGVNVAPLANLKLAAPPPHCDPEARVALAAEIGSRPLWIAASTHAGEDEIVLAAHKILRARAPQALLVLAPRHPERGEAVAALAGGAPRRATGATIGDGAVYIADTLGELGLFYSVAPVALVAGSLLPHLKGHNPIEPARLGAAIVVGPYVESFDDIYASLFSNSAAISVTDAETLARAVERLWSEGDARRLQVEAARETASQGAEALAQTLTAIDALLPVRASTAKVDNASA